MAPARPEAPDKTTAEVLFPGATIHQQPNKGLVLVPDASLTSFATDLGIKQPQVHCRLP